MEKLNIVIVEDEAINSIYLRMLIERMGHTVLDIFISGEETLEKVFDLKPDVILMDIYLEGQLDGIETVSKIHETLYIPVIYITASTDSATHKRAEETRLTAYITKPFMQEDLEDALSLACNTDSH